MIFINYFIFINEYLIHVLSPWGYHRLIKHGVHIPFGETRDLHMKRKSLVLSSMGFRMVGSLVRATIVNLSWTCSLGILGDLPVNPPFLFSKGEDA